MIRASSSIAAAVGVCLLVATHGHAAEALRWKFAAGDAFETSISHEMQLDLDGPSGKLTTTAREELDMTWRVRGATLTGDAVLAGKCDRVRASLTDADREGLEFDSAVEEATAGLAAMIAPMYEAMNDGEYQVTVSPRGEVREVQLPPDFEQTIRTAPGAESTGQDAAVDALRAVVTRWIVELPADPPTVGQTWSTRTPVHIPAAKSAAVISEYRYDGTREVDGRTCAVILVDWKLDVQADEGAATSVEDQQTKGEVLFDAGTGRLRAMSIDHRATLEIGRAGQVMRGTIAQRVAVQVRGTTE